MINMIALSELKYIIDTLPISGDIAEIIDDDRIKYQSGRILPLDKPRILAEGAKVISVKHEFIEKTEELLISIDHFLPPRGYSWFEKVVINRPKLTRIHRCLKEKKLGWIKK